MKNEPTIEQLEKLLEAFRKVGGSDSEISLLAREILYDYLPNRIKPLEEIFTKETHDTISKINHFKELERHPMKHALSDLWRNRIFRYSSIVIAVFCLVFVFLNFPLMVEKVKPVQKTYETVKEVVRPTTAKSAPLEPGETIPATDTLVVPKIGVTAPIIYSDTINEAAIDTDLQKGVVHYVDTALPGEAGNVFITGHSSNYWWIKGKYNYVFANLNRLTVGDQAKIYYQGNKILYQVTGVKTVLPTDVSVLAQTETPTLTLMTCTPPGTNWKRLIVSFTQISPQYIAPRVVEKQQEVTANKLPATDSNNFFGWLLKWFSF